MTTSQVQMHSASHLDAGRRGGVEGAARLPDAPGKGWNAAHEDANCLARVLHGDIVQDVLPVGPPKRRHHLHFQI